VSDKAIKYSKGTYKATCCLPGHFLNEGAYFVGLAISSFETGVRVHLFEKNALSFNVNDTMENITTRSGWAGVMPGVVRPKMLWKTTEA
jgi:lipopolysaccharide transport system ATP-binding protein